MWAGSGFGVLRTLLEPDFLELTLVLVLLHTRRRGRWPKE
jgi:hypothetical protein